MTDGTTTLLDKLRRMEEIASQVETGSGRLFQLDHAATLREAIAALSRTLSGVGDGCEPSEAAVETACRDWFNDAWPGGDLWSDRMRAEMRLVLTNSYAIDLAARVSDAYARGVEDAAKMVHGACADYHDEEAAIRSIRQLLPKAPATEDAREKEATERDDDMEAAHCVKYYQQRELD